MVNVRVGATNWFYQDEGARDLPALLLLHGFSGCTDFWDEIVTELKSDFRCIRVDLPAHGRTENPVDTGNCRMEMVAEWLSKMMDEIGVDRFHLWGYSMGGRLALHLALRFPERVQRLILESASPGIADPEDRRQRAAEDAELADQIERQGLSWFVEEWMKRPLFASQQDLSVEKQARARELRMRNTTSGLALSLRCMGTGVQESLHGMLSQLKPPAMILTGEYDDKFRAIGLEMAGLIPQVLYCLIPRAGHAPFWEQPESCVRAVRPFLLGHNAPR